MSRAPFISSNQRAEGKDKEKEWRRSKQLWWEREEERGWPRLDIISSTEECDDEDYHDSKGEEGGEGGGQRVKWPFQWRRLLNDCIVYIP